MIIKNARKYKWHVLPLVAPMVAGKTIPPLNSRTIEAYCQKIVDVFQVQNERISPFVTNASNIIASLPDVFTQRLRRQTSVEELLARI